jgi:transcription-repair coupling factor (superfamily II helicase)
VGVELYQEMLKEAVMAARMGEGDANTVEEVWSPVINMGTAVLIPDGYVEDLTVRLSLYRRIAAMVDLEEMDQLSAELVDRFGPIPDEVRNLLDTITIKILCRAANIARIDAGPKGLSLAFKNNTFPNPDRLIGHISSKSGTMQLTGEYKLIIKRTLPLSQRAKVITETLQELVELADSRVSC